MYRKLKELVEIHGTKKWTMIANILEGREGKQCRERWLNHLRPNIKRDAWTEEEDQILVDAHKVSGTKWTEIAKQLSGRSENAIKNHWNATKRRIIKTKKNGEDVIRPHNNILKNYLKDASINKKPSKQAEVFGLTKNTMDDDECEGVYDEERNLSLNVTTQNTKSMVDESVTSVYVPEPATFT
ncbi:unnamed protein product [Thlaspi arvense]|uniref:Uncharacterized protein n=1 Tax=Thlaspi arvense TaxID=13288 RepID=A0AAU9T730_THLAR|nr:unnamed protein product [Thlaspi arvense]